MKILRATALDNGIIRKISQIPNQITLKLHINQTMILNELN
jgi:hypothetical protein